MLITFEFKKRGRRYQRAQRGCDRPFKGKR